MSNPLHVFIYVYPQKFCFGVIWNHTSSNKTCGRAGFFRIVWNDIAIVLPAFTIRLFEANHVSISCITLFSLDWTMFRLSPDISTFVSSTNNTILGSRTFNGKSFMYDKNNNGPTVEPCGTLCVISLVRQMFLDSCS